MLPLHIRENSALISQLWKDTIWPEHLKGWIVNWNLWWHFVQNDTGLSHLSVLLVTTKSSVQDWTHSHLRNKHQEKEMNFESDRTKVTSKRGSGNLCQMSWFRQSSKGESTSIDVSWEPKPQDRNTHRSKIFWACNEPQSYFVQRTQKCFCWRQNFEFTKVKQASVISPLDPKAQVKNEFPVSGLRNPCSRP